MSNEVTSLPAVVLRPGRDRSVRRRHPWVLSGSVAGIEGPGPGRGAGGPGEGGEGAAAGAGVSGAWARVVSAEGETLGWGHLSPASRIRVRMLSFAKEPPDDGLVSRRIAAAVARRRDLPLLGDTDGVRLVNAEGDGLPGLVADRYGDVVVVRLTSAGMAARRERVAAALREASGASFGLERAAGAEARREGIPVREGPLWGPAPGGPAPGGSAPGGSAPGGSAPGGAASGAAPPGAAPSGGALPGGALPSGSRGLVSHLPVAATGDAGSWVESPWLPPPLVTFREGGREYRVDVVGGQKTGFYLDQRDARSLVERLARGRRVLDLFAYTGGFGVAGARGGAREVTLVETSGAALELARENLARNAPEVPARLVQADVFRWLRGVSETWDLLVVDPPPLARRRGDVPRAARAYKDVLLGALRRADAGAWVLAFACSHHVGPELFRKICFGASLDAGRPARVLAELGAPADHPVSLDHPEGRYLSGLLLEMA